MTPALQSLRLLKSSEVMELLNCSRTKLRALVAEKKLFPLPDFGKHWRFSSDDINEYLESQRAEARARGYYHKGRKFMNAEIMEML